MSFFREIRAGGAGAQVYVDDFPKGNCVYENCLIEDSGGSGAGWDMSLGVDGGGNLDADPLFVDPVDAADAPTTAGNLRLGPGSPAIDAGDAALLPADSFDLDGDTEEPLPVDLDGQPRVLGSAVDLGAFEMVSHASDTDRNLRVSLSELLRAVQLFNARALHCAGGAEDGYAPGPGNQDCPPHDLDFAPQDWRLSLTELLRLIQLYSFDAYTTCPETEDGFCPAGAVQ